MMIFDLYQKNTLDEEFVSLADKSLTTPSRAARGKAKKAKYNFSSSEEDD